MRCLKARRRTWLLAGVMATGLAGATVAAAAILTAGSPVRVPDNPLGASAACAPQVAQQTAAGSINYPDAEIEPYVAADPTNRTTSSRASSRIVGTTAAPTASSTSSRRTVA